MSAREKLLKAQADLSAALSVVKQANAPDVVQSISNDDLLVLTRAREEFERAKDEYDAFLEIQKAQSAVSLSVPDEEEYVRYDSAGVSGGTMSMYDYITRSEEFVAMASNWQGTAKFSEIPVSAFTQKSLMTTTGIPAGYPNEITRTGAIDWRPQVAVTLLDILPTRTTTQGGWKFMRETLYDNKAGFKEEGELSQGSALRYEEVTGTFGTIMTWVIASEEQLEDEALVRSIVNDRLPLMVREKLEDEIINGNGQNRRPLGILNYGIGSVAHVGTLVDQILTEYAKIVSIGNGSPNLLAMRTHDWVQIRLMRTQDGVYIYGSPNEAMRPTVFGIPVVVVDRLPVGVVLIGDTSHLDLVYGRGITLDTSRDVGTNFIAGVVTFRVSARLGVELRRPAAFTQITGVTW